MLGWFIYMRTGRYPEAERLIRRGLQIGPKFHTGQYWLAVNLLMQGRLDEALLEANKESLDHGRLEGSAAIYHAQHRERESRAALGQAIERNGNSWASNIAKVYAFLGEADQALEWPDRAYAQRDEELYFIKGDPMLRGLEQDVGYRAFLKKMNLSDVE
jgi:tetratricopeptide (TPR) repeat protein